MEIELITCEDRLFEIRDKWDALSDNSPISMTATWLLNWWKCFKKNAFTIHVIAVWQDGELIALLPTMLERCGKEAILRFISTNCSDYLSVIVEQSNEHCIVDIVNYLVSDISWDRIMFEKVPDNDMHFQKLLKALIGHGMKLQIEKQDDTRQITLSEEWEQLLRIKTKNTRRAYRNIEERQINFSFRVIIDYEPDVIEHMFKLHIRRWDRENQVSGFYDERRRKFVHCISKAFAEKGHLRIFVLENEKGIVAYRYGFVCNKIYYDWNTSFDIDYEKLEVGKILLKKVYDHCISNDIGLFDFMRGNERYKNALATESGFLYKVNCINRGKSMEPSIPQAEHGMSLSSIHGVIFDLDGVVYSGDKPIVDTIESIRLMQAKNISVGFLTNTSTKSTGEIKDKLNYLGLDTSNCKIMTSSMATAKYMKEHGVTNCRVIGGDYALRNEIECNNIQIIETIDNEVYPDAVVVGFKKELNNKQIKTLADDINTGALFICTDKDKEFSYEGGWMPGTGWIVNALEYMTGKEAITIGKPEVISLLYLMEEMHIDKEECLLVGDNMETDIIAAKKKGVMSCLLFGGISTREEIASLPSEDKPDICVDSLLKIIDEFRKVETYEQDRRF